MPRNFVIGIGGTGARCVESFLHLCAAGLGPDNVSVGLIDQDEGNGNVERTLALAESLVDLRALLRQDGGHRLASTAPFLRTEISLIGTNGFWCPLRGDNPTIRDAFGYSTMGESVKTLFEGLFSRDESQMSLNQGYRARPSLGAAVLAGQALGPDPFWKALADGLRQGAGGAGGSRLFIFGSLFGGTGAAGFPTLARVVREHPLMEGVIGIELGGSLMLPYFQFEEPKAEDGKARAHASEFIQQTENALRYYNRLFEADQVYNEVYMIGWSPFISLPYLADGGQKQANPPMVPELYAGLAAARFLAASGTFDGTRFYKIGTRQEGEVEWSDLPPVLENVGESTDVARERVRSALARQLSFSFAFRRVYRPALLPRRWRRYRREEWMRRLVLSASVNLEDITVGAVLDRVDRFAEAHLRWAAGLAASGAGGAARPLYDFQHYARLERQEEGGPSSIRLHDERRLDGNPMEVWERPNTLDANQRQGFSRLTTSGTGASLAEVMHRLTYKKPDRQHQMLGRFIGELHAACDTGDSSAD